MRCRLKRWVAGLLVFFACSSLRLWYQRCKNCCHSQRQSLVEADSRITRELSTWGQCLPTAPKALVAVESLQADAEGRARLRAAWKATASLTPATAQLVFFVHYSPNASWPAIIREFYANTDLVLSSLLPFANDVALHNCSTTAGGRCIRQQQQQQQQQILQPRELQWFDRHCSVAQFLLQASVSAELRPRLLPDILFRLTTGNAQANQTFLLGECTLLKYVRSNAAHSSVERIASNNATNIEPLCVQA